MPMSALDLLPYVPDIASELIEEHASFQDADAIERLADDLISSRSDDPLDEFIVIELRARARRLRQPAP